MKSTQEKINTPIKTEADSLIPIDVPLDFDFSELKPTNLHGGSSKVYELSSGYIVKERLLKGEASFVENERIRLENNIRVCEKYLADFILKTRVIVKPNRDGMQTLFIIQETLPKEVATLDPDNWNLVFDDQIREKLRQMIMAIEKMYQETKAMIDLLTLNNVAFSSISKNFYLYDFDPLICSEDDLERLRENLVVESSISHHFVTSLDNDTRNAIEANFENLQTLKTLLDTPK